MRVAVAGATGLAGRATSAELRNRGADVVGLTRSHGVDLLTGQGLDGALVGCDLVIDATNPSGGDMPRDVAVTTAARRLVDACLDQDVPRVAVLSVLGIDDPGFDDFAYYRAKREQERIVRESSLDGIVLRSAQWFEFATNPAAVTPVDGRLEVGDWWIQPAAVDSVARALVDAALGTHSGTRSVAGPEPMRLPQLTRRYLSARGDAREVVGVEPPLAAFGSGALLADSDTDQVGPTVDEWLGTVAELTVR